jgi:hypothetical protein
MTRVRAVVLVAVGLLALGLTPAGAATDNGTARIVSPGGRHRPLAGGGSATGFNLDLGRNPTCPGDSAGGDYRLQSFMVPAATDPNSLTFDAHGPVAVAGQFRQPLFDATGSPYVDELTDLAVAPAVTGGISGLPTFDFGVFAPGDVPVGEYSIGIACTLGPAGPTQLASFWRTRITVAESASDLPAGITWTGPAPPATPRGDNPTSTTAPGGRSTATTTPGGRAGATTVPGDTTTTSTPGEVAFAGSGPSDPSMFRAVGQLRLTGSSPWYFIVWGVLLVVFGRIAVLLVRRPKVLPPSDG